MDFFDSYGIMRLEHITPMGRFTDENIRFHTIPFYSLESERAKLLDDDPLGFDRMANYAVCRNVDDWSPQLKQACQQKRWFTNGNLVIKKPDYRRFGHYTTFQLIHTRITSIRQAKGGDTERVSLHVLETIDGYWD